MYLGEHGALFTVTHVFLHRRPHSILNDLQHDVLEMVRDIGDLGRVSMNDNFRAHPIPSEAFT